MKSYRSLLIRCNRFLGAALHDSGLITVDHLEQANERMLESLQSGNLHRASILNILVSDVMAMKERELVQFTVENLQLSAVDLRSYNLAKTTEIAQDIEACWATWSVPFDLVEDIYFVATAYYLSRAVVEYWEDLLNGTVIWYVTSMESIADALERLQPSEELLISEPA